MSELKTKLVTLKNNIVDMAKNAKETAEKVCVDIIDWAIDNPEAATAALVPTACAAIRAGQSRIVSHRERRKVEYKEYTWYDPSTGLRWHLKRKMTNNDRQAIVRLKQSGVDSVDILVKLNLI